ncbi:MAG: NUDIX domain-containing protein [Candidatus Thermoplasmatota archaeon]|nr:NUDIX domain-containing protein [Candidatus Thermoplasmatota archaeon]
MKTRIWLTGFEPFGSHEENPSQFLVEQLLNTNHRLHLKSVSPYGLECESIEVEFKGRILSVDESGSRDSLKEIDGFDAIIHVGLNENAEKVRLEMCAVNESDFRIPDNQGRMVRETFVEETGFSLLHTTVHRPSISAAFSSNDAVEISEDCGRFVCNETYYRTLHEIETKGFQSRDRSIPAIFVHIPDFSHVSVEKQVKILLELAARISQKPVVQVVGAVMVNHENKILACRRSVNQVMGGLWEFPGGKVDAGETTTQALERELFEELGAIVEIGSLIDTVVHDYPSMIVNLEFYKCESQSESLSKNVHDEFQWVDENTAKELDWLPADVGFVNQLVENGFSSI